MIRREHLRGLRAGIVGAAREGTALVRFLAGCGAEVHLADAKPAEALAQRLGALESLAVAYHLGGEPLPMADLDVLFVSPGVPPTAPVVGEARRRGLPISSEPRLFTQVCPAPVVGVTGSSGKTTTTALTGDMLHRQGLATWVGGNIGTPLTERLADGERMPDVAVLELSSFQLEMFSPDYQGEGVDALRSEASRVVSTEGWSPAVALVTNVTPNHLDRHPSMEDYVRAKTQILAYQRGGDCAVLNADDPRSGALGALVRGRLLLFSLEAPVPEGAFVADESLVLRRDGRETIVAERGALRLRGRHNVANALAAICAAAEAGAGVEAMGAALAEFAGVAHRLEVVRTVNGVQYVNDSIATSPERAMAALRAFQEPLVLLAGGRDKHLPWDEWADLAHERARLVVGFGEAVPIIQSALEDARARRSLGPGAGATLHAVGTLDEAVEVAARLARPGEVVLLSPGGTSFDAYVDFEARGERFRERVSAL